MDRMKTIVLSNHDDCVDIAEPLADEIMEKIPVDIGSYVQAKELVYDVIMDTLLELLE